MKFPNLPNSAKSVAEVVLWASRLVLQLERLRGPAVGEVTLTLNAASTKVANAAMRPTSVVVFTPLHANAAAEIGGGTMYVSAKATGSFTITHANSATASRTFDYSITDK